MARKIESSRPQRPIIFDSTVIHLGPSNNGDMQTNGNDKRGRNGHVRVVSPEIRIQPEITFPTNLNRAQEIALSKTGYFSLDVNQMPRKSDFKKTNRFGIKVNDPVSYTAALKEYQKNSPEQRRQGWLKEVRENVVVLTVNQAIEDATREGFNKYTVENVTQELWDKDLKSYVLVTKPRNQTIGYSEAENKIYMAQTIGGELQNALNQAIPLTVKAQIAPEDLSVVRSIVLTTQLHIWEKLSPKTREELIDAKPRVTITSKSAEDGAYQIKTSFIVVNGKEISDGYIDEDVRATFELKPAKDVKKYVASLQQEYQGRIDDQADVIKTTGALSALDRAAKKEETAERVINEEKELEESKMHFGSQLEKLTALESVATVVARKRLIKDRNILVNLRCNYNITTEVELLDAIAQEKKRTGKSVDISNDTLKLFVRINSANQGRLFMDNEVNSALFTRYALERTQDAASGDSLARERDAKIERSQNDAPGYFILESTTGRRGKASKIDFENENPGVNNRNIRGKLEEAFGVCDHSKTLDIEVVGSPLISLIEVKAPRNVISDRRNRTTSNEIPQSDYLAHALAALPADVQRIQQEINGTQFAIARFSNGAITILDELGHQVTVQKGKIPNEKQMLAFGLSPIDSTFLLSRLQDQL